MQLIEYIKISECKITSLIFLLARFNFRSFILRQCFRKVYICFNISVCQELVNAIEIKIINSVIYSVPS